MRLVAAVIYIASTFALAGCVNPYAKFYQSTNQPSDRFIAFQGEPRVAGSSGDPRQDIRRYFEDGYALVGVAAFTGSAQKPANAIAQAKKVGAAVIVITSKYRNTESGMMPMTTPTTNTSYSSGLVNAYGSRGYGYGSYSGTTTTYGTQTTYIPYSVDKYEQAALFFTPLARSGTGVLFDRLTDEQKRAIGSNSGVQILAVRRGSPAFNADILPGDVITSINGASVYDLQSFQSAAIAAAGRPTAEVVIYRGADRMTKNVSAQATW